MNRENPENGYVKRKLYAYYLYLFLLNGEGVIVK